MNDFLAQVNTGKLFTVLAIIAALSILFALLIVTVSKLCAVKEDGRIEEFIKRRYASYESGVGKRITEGKETLESLAAYAADLKDIKVQSGRQEYLEAILNDILFSGKA